MKCMKRIIIFGLFGGVCALLCGADPDALVRRVAVYDFGGDPAAVRELEALTLGATGNAAQALENLLIAGLGMAKTLAAKDAFCRDLAMVGSDAAVPKLAAMLLAPDTSEMARYALERIGGARVASALRDALPRTSSAVQTGIVVSLGRRRDAASVDAIRPLIASKDASLANAAAWALGNIATDAAREALLAAKPSPAVTAGLLAIAERSSPQIAAGIYARLGPAGLEGLARADARQAAPLLHAALKSDSARLQSMAIRQLARLEGVALAKELPNVTERARVQILSALADSGKSEVLPVLVEAAAGDSEAVRVTALNGLAKLGTAAEVPMLAGRAAAAAGDEQTAARAALGALRGDAANAAILKAIPGAEPKIKVELIRAVGERGITSAAEVLLAGASDTNRPVRIESIRALRETAGPRQVAALLPLLAKTSNENDRREFERTVASAIRRSREAPITEVTDAYAGSTDPGVRISLLNVLSTVGNSAALPVLRQALQDPSPDIRRAALNALSGWPTAEPMEDLLALARSAGDPARQILALRGYIKLVQVPSNRSPAETARLLKTAMEAATRVDEKRAVLAAAQRLMCPESLELARSAVKDPQVAAEAQLAVTTLERGLGFLNK